MLSTVSLEIDDANAEGLGFNALYVIEYRTLPLQLCWRHMSYGMECVGRTI
jgi:hypothetical protein